MGRVFVTMATQGHIHGRSSKAMPDTTANAWDETRRIFKVSLCATLTISNK
jgi:hypothetical protein